MLKYLSLRLIAAMRPATCGMNFCGFQNEDYTKTTPQKATCFMVYEVCFLFVTLGYLGYLGSRGPPRIFLDGKIQDREKPPGLSANITAMHHKKWLKKELGARCKDHGPTRCVIRVYKNKSNSPSQILFKYIDGWCISSIIYTCISRQSHLNPISTSRKHWLFEAARITSQHVATTSNSNPFVEIDKLRRAIFGGISWKNKYQHHHEINYKRRNT